MNRDDDYSLASRRLMLQIAKERVAALIEEANAGLAHVPAGGRLPGRAGALRLGAVTIPESQPFAAVTDEAAFTAWVVRTWPRETCDVLRPGASADPRVVALVKEHLPELVQQAVSPVFRSDVTESVLAHGGFHDENGVVQPVPGVERNPGGQALTPRAALDEDVKKVAKNPLEPLPLAVTSGFGEIGLLSLPAGGESDG